MSLGFAVAQIQRGGKRIQREVVTGLQVCDELGVVDCQCRTIGNGAEQVKVVSCEKLTISFVHGLNRADGFIFQNQRHGHQRAGDEARSFVHRTGMARVILRIFDDDGFLFGDAGADNAGGIQRHRQSFERFGAGAPGKAASNDARFLIHQPDGLGFSVDGFIYFDKNAGDEFVNIQGLVQVAADLVEQFLPPSGAVVSFIKLCVLNGERNVLSDLMYEVVVVVGEGGLASLVDDIDLAKQFSAGDERNPDHIADGHVEVGAIGS